MSFMSKQMFSPLACVVFILLFGWSSAVNYTCDQSAACGCSTMSSATVSSKIVGGEAAPNRAWGWMISLQYNQRHTCGASLLTSEIAITAAHCVYERLASMNKYTITAGSNYWNDPESSIIQKRSIIGIYVHPNYNPTTKANDIALLRFAALNTDVASTLSFICLPQNGVDSFTTNTTLVAIGWGALYEGATSSPGWLQQVTIQAISSSDTSCKRVMQADSNLQFCAGVLSGGKDTCQGDSGGPIMAFVDKRWILVGLTSYGEGCARANAPGIYTRVSTFVSTIQYVLDNPSAALSTSTTSTTMTTVNSVPNQVINSGDGHSDAHRQFHSFECFILISVLILFLLVKSNIL